MSNTPFLHFTDNAAAKVLELVNEENNPSLKLRVFITGGGCSGFQYGFTFDEEIKADDIVIEKAIFNVSPTLETQQVILLLEAVKKIFTSLLFTITNHLSLLINAIEKVIVLLLTTFANKVTLLVDGLSYQYLAKAKIDYRKDAYGEQFIISNPNAKTTCGCGSSFSVDHAAEAA